MADDLGQTDQPQSIASPIRGLNLDAPVQLLRSGECKDAINVNLINHAGAIGRRGCFVPQGSALTSSHVGKIQNFVEWQRESDGLYYIVYKALGLDKIYAWDMVHDTITDIGLCHTTDPGNLFVWGTDLYYCDISYSWFYGYQSYGSAGYYKYDNWGIYISGSPAAPTVASSATGALGPGCYRYCVAPYDSKRDIEGRRSPFSSVIRIGLTDAEDAPDNPQWVSDPSQPTGYRGVKPDSDDSGANPGYTGGVTVNWADTGWAGRFDKWRLYRTAPNTDFTSRDSEGAGSFSCLATLVAELPRNTVTYTDNGGELDANWDQGKCLQAGEAPEKARLVVAYGNTALYFSTYSRPGGYERSVSGKYCQIARNFSITEGGQARTRVPLVDHGGGVCPIPATYTAAFDYGGQNLVFTRTNLFRLSGGDQSPYLDRISPNHGTPGRWAVVDTDWGLVWWDGAGLCRLVGSHVEPFPTKGIDSILNSIAAAYRDNVVVGYCSQTKELLVAYQTGDWVQYVLSFDFQRSCWFLYQVKNGGSGSLIYGFFEASFPANGKQLYALTSGGAMTYPSSSGETFTGIGGSYAEAVFGTEDLSTLKEIDTMRITVGAAPVKLTVKGYYASADNTNVATATYTGTGVEINNSFLIQPVSNRQIAGRYIDIKAEPVTPGADWSIDCFDVLGLVSRELKG